MSALAEFQSQLAAAVLMPATLPENQHEKFAVGLTVYQNTVIKGLIDALRANYPAVQRLVGDDWFDAVARDYVRTHPPHAPTLALYGSTLPAYLVDLSTAHGLPYLPYVAQLDRLWIEVHFAPDAPLLSGAHLHALSPEQLAARTVQLHPATRMAWLPHCAVRIWQHNREASALDELVVTDSAEGVLLTRPNGAVQITPLNDAAYFFLQQLVKGSCLAEAATLVLAQHPEVDLADVVAMLINTGAFAAPGDIADSLKNQNEDTHDYNHPALER